jgi:hypothetical protein
VKRKSSQNPQFVFTLVPRLLRIPQAAEYIGSSTFHIEELMRGGQLPFRIMGQHRAVEIKHLDNWIDKVPLRTGKMDCNVSAEPERSTGME